MDIAAKVCASASLDGQAFKRSETMYDEALDRGLGRVPDCVEPAAPGEVRMALLVAAVSPKRTSIALSVSLVVESPNCKYY